MELLPKLHAAADMCETGEEVNLDELAFLLRYAAGELAERPEAVVERDQLIARLRQRLLARCDLLQRPDSETKRARNGSLAELEELEAELDHLLRHRLIASPSDEPAVKDHPGTETEPSLAARYSSGR